MTCEERKKKKLKELQNNSTPPTLMCWTASNIQTEPRAKKLNYLKVEWLCRGCSVCMCVCVMLVCSWKITERKENDKLERWGKKKKTILAKWTKTKRNFTPTHPPRTAPQAATDFCFSLFGKRIVGLHLLTLYLSTIGSLTGPSLDLVKFGKLSRWAINGKPLVRNKKGKLSISQC